MFKRQPGKPDAPDASAYSRRSAVADSLWAAQDRLRSGFGSAARTTGAAVKQPLDAAVFALQEKLIWPAGDRAATVGEPARTLSFGALVLLAAAAGVAGLVWAAPDKPQGSAATQVAVSQAPAAKTGAAPTAAAESEPTLQGATPVFKPAEARATSEVDPAKAIVKSSPSPSSAASTAPAEASAAGASASSARAAGVDGPPAGPEAIAVARDFAAAFVLYETGEGDSGVRQAFAETATPALSQALLKRPPRLPADVQVPRAKVVNVVPAPSQGGIYPVSVSLLRVGLTSELRLDLEQRKGDGWRVTNVLG